MKMMMGSEDDENHQKMLVILTGMDGMSWSGIQWLLDALRLPPGGELILLALLRLLDPPPPPPPSAFAFSFTAAAKILGIGYKRGEEEEEQEKVSNKKKFVVEELRRLREECRSDPGFLQFHRLCEVHKIKLRVVAEEAGSSPKAAAVRAAKNLGATWVVLDREMKKDKQYFMDRLSCGLSSMKSNNTLRKVRGPLIRKVRGPAKEHISYDEMIPSYSWEATSPSKTPGDQTAVACEEKTSSSSNKPLLSSSQSVGSTSGSMETSSTLNIQEIESNTDIKQETVEKSTRQATKSPKNSCKAYKMLHHNRGSERPFKNQRELEFEYSICSVCQNPRLKFGLQRDFTYLELYEATNRFSRHNFLSEGGFGSVYMGKLKNGQKIAVKQLKAASLQGEKEFKSEVRVLSQARHQNLVVLLGSCAERSHRLLVYEYICNGSLEKHLSGDSLKPLNWEQRMKIACGAAQGLAYLHRQNIIHRDMRPSNILITHDHESLLGDFGLARAQQDGSHSCESVVVGTLGYMAPEYAESGRMSTKTDVYSFGVILLQLITGRRTTDRFPGGKSLVGWAKPLLETKNYPDLIDKRILDFHDVHQLFWMVLVAEKSLKKDPDNRWTMEQVVHNLNCIKEGNTSPWQEESSSRILDCGIK